MVKSVKGHIMKRDSPSHLRPHPTHQKEQFIGNSSGNMSSTGRHMQTHPQTLSVVEIGICS